jgi:hypothetical protein
MISRAIGFCLMPVDNRTCFIVVTPKDLHVPPKEIMFAANRFNRTSVALPVERNSGMDRCSLTNLTATGNELRTIFATVAASTSLGIRSAVSMNSRPAMAAPLPRFVRTNKTASSRIQGRAGGGQAQMGGYCASAACLKLRCCKAIADKLKSKSSTTSTLVIPSASSTNYLRPRDEPLSGARDSSKSCLARRPEGRLVLRLWIRCGSVATCARLQLG